MGMFELQFNSKNSADEKFNLEGDLFYGVKVKGLIGQRFEIQFTTDVSNGNWKSLGFLTLKEDEEIFIDKDGIGGKRRFYRALLRKR